ncbi:hypothetical protein Hanom_Chr02g00108071 [Helianthus anomalus]
MNNEEKQQSVDDRYVNDENKSSEDSSSVSCVEERTDAVSRDSSTRRSGNGIGLADRLTNLFVGAEIAMMIC